MPDFPPREAQNPTPEGVGRSGAPSNCRADGLPDRGCHHVSQCRVAGRPAGRVWANYELVMVQWPGVERDALRSGLGESYPAQDGTTIVGANPTPPCHLNDPGDPQKPVEQRNGTVRADRHRMQFPARPEHAWAATTARSTDFIFALPLSTRPERRHQGPVMPLEHLRAPTSTNIRSLCAAMRRRVPPRAIGSEKACTTSPSPHDNLSTGGAGERSRGCSS